MAYRQIVKANDDLRQDSVISSVFNMMNIILKRDLQARRRKLSIRTYKIVPLCPQAGVIEWIENTIPLGDLLKTNHVRIRPKDWTPKKIRQMMSEQKTINSKLSAYNDIEKHFKPIFGHIFFEIYRSPYSWFQKRTSYSRSVAAMAIAGYVLGLGDRHSHNILFDDSSGELVHIDLGIAFDQGKLLSTPEVVPFRLTRDIVHAMGITQTAGVFQKSCQEMLRCLRGNSNVLYTLLEVFRHDPLFHWTVSPIRVAQNPIAMLKSTSSLQDDNMNTRTEAQEHAERALLSVKKKLNNGSSIECHINELIQAATDKNFLCRMYAGWEAWL